MVELVGIEKLGTLKTDKLLTCRESYNAHKASNVCKAGFIVRLLYGDSQSKQLRFHDKVRSQPPRRDRLERDFAQGTRETVEIVADVFNTSRVTKKTSFKPHIKQLHFQRVGRQSLSVNFGPPFALTQSEVS